MKIAIVGAGGQARIVYEILSYNPELAVVAFIDNIVHQENDEYIMGIPVTGDHSVITDLMGGGVRGVVIAVGDNQIRAAHFGKFRELGLEMVSAIHPNTVISPSARLGSGVTIAMGAILSTGSSIGDNVIINTGATVDHENVIADHVHIGPGCSLAGRVTIKRGAFIGIGSVVKEYVTIGENTIIGAGAVVLEDVPDNVVAAGAPARIIKER